MVLTNFPSKIRFWKARLIVECFGDFASEWLQGFSAKFNAFLKKPTPPKRVGARQRPAIGREIVDDHAVHVGFRQKYDFHGLLTLA